MRHNKKKHNLASKKGGSRLVIRNLVTSLLMFDKVRTTLPRAKSTAREIDRLISYAKKNNTVNAIRRLKTFVFTEEASRKVMEQLVARYKERPSGFTSRRQVGYRKGDGATLYEVSLME